MENNKTNIIYQFEDLERIAQKAKKLSKEEEIELIKNTSFPNSAVESKLLLNNLGIIKNRFIKYKVLANYSLTEEDIFAIVTDAFIKTIRNYDPKLGSLSTLYYLICKQQIYQLTIRNKKSKIPQDKLVYNFINEEGEEEDILNLVEDPAARFENLSTDKAFASDIITYMPIVLTGRERTAIMNAYFVPNTKIEGTRQNTSSLRLKALKKLKILAYYLLDENEKYESLKNELGELDRKRFATFEKLIESKNENRLTK